jgi:DNA polymerase I
MYPEI